MMPTFDLFQNYPIRSTHRHQSVINFIEDACSARGILISSERKSLSRPGVRGPGEYSVMISADRWASGVYLCRLSAGGYEKSIKLLLMR